MNKGNIDVKFTCIRHFKMKIRNIKKKNNNHDVYVKNMRSKIVRMQYNELQ